MGIMKIVKNGVKWRFKKIYKKKQYSKEMG